MANLQLMVLDEVLAVCRLESGGAVPAWAKGDGLWSITRTAEELSVVCRAERVPVGVMRQERFRALKVQGPLDFALTGILAGLTKALAEAGVPVFAISTYDTDYLLVREEKLEQAIGALRGAGYGVS